MRSALLIFALFCGMALQAFGQNDRLKLKVSFSEDHRWLKRINYNDRVRDSLDMLDQLDHIIIVLRKRSYLASAVDTIRRVGNTYYAHVFVGEKLHWARLGKGNMEEEVLSKTGYRDKVYNGYRFRYRQFGRFTENILTYYENHGYPFVSLRLDSIRYYEGKGISARLHLEKNKYITFDSIHIHGPEVVAPGFLFNYLSIKPHSAYHEGNVAAISRRFTDLTFMTEERPAQVFFTETYTSLHLFPKKKKASRFDGIIGLLQDEKTSKVQFTGDVKLGLMNTFKRGELIGLNWRGLPNNTQDLNLKFNLPYILNSPFGIDVDFKLYKRDTTFLDVVSTLGIQYFLNARDYLKVLYQNHRSNLISTDQYKEATALPPVLDFNTDLYGAEISFNKLDYILNPTRGFRILVNSRTGFKTIRKNPNIKDSLYDGLSLKNVVFKAELNGGIFLPIASRHVIFLGNQSAFLQNPQILRNELFRIGGLKTLRGFNEESIFVSSYAIGTIEYRFILDKNSNLNAFGDFAITESRLYNQPTLIDYPFGFGVGTTFETAAGMFTVSYAVGTQRGNPVDFRGAKIHFGFLNFF